MENTNEKPTEGQEVDPTIISPTVIDVMEETFISVKDAAKKLGMSVSHTHTLMKAEKIPYIVFSEKKIVIPVSILNAKLSAMVVNND